MDGINPTAKPGFWIAIAIGGFVVAVLSFAQQYASKQSDEPFRMRSIFRDFFLGAFLSATIYMFLPESIDTWMSFLITKTTSVTATAAAGSGLSSDLELHTGPARF